MLKRLSFNLSLNMKLILMMLFLSFILVAILMFFYTRSEKRLLLEMERQASELTKAIQIGVEEVTGHAATDEARLAKYLEKLNAKGINEISIISNTDEIVASSNPSKVGQAITHKRKELIIKAELGEPVSEEGRAFNVILPVIAGNTQYGYVHLKINKDDFSEILQRSAIERIAATVFIFGVGILITVILSRHYTRPIRQVVRASKRVAAGDLNQNIPVKSRDEIGELSETFNFMVRKLKESRTLEERLREAEHLSALGQLSRNIAHEIRNPLNFINLSIDHMSEKYKPEDPAKQEKFANLIGGIKQEVQRLDKLVNDYLDYSRPMKLNKRRVRVDGLLADVIDLVWAKAEADRIELERESCERCTSLELDVDPDLLKSCILNVIGNAFHATAATERPGMITVRTDLVNDEFVISVRDNGKGVSRENLSRIFEPFFSTRQDGLGLGLPMTKRVVEEHGGRVEFVTVEGEGSEVRLFLPLRKAPDREPELAGV
ncbi:MAG TPA: ATP-binding protein [Dissulfurispiraceae bacterium]|nr:ATP-binding protein [Dissulfurispiraceae bacterium]